MEANNSGRIIPHEGVDVEYDSACKKVKEVESSLTEHLKDQKKLLGDASVRTFAINSLVFEFSVVFYFCLYSTENNQPSVIQ